MVVEERAVKAEVVAEAAAWADRRRLALSVSVYALPVACVSLMFGGCRARHVSARSVVRP